MSLDSSIRSAAQATYSAYRRVPIRWRLAGGSAALTFVILCGFAVIVGFLTTRQIGIQFKDSVNRTADALATYANGRIGYDAATGAANCGQLGALATGESGKLTVYNDSRGGEIMCFYGSSQRAVFKPQGTYPRDESGYRVTARWVTLNNGVERALIIYGRPLSATKATIAKVRFFIVFGVLGGAALALAAGLFVARRAMAPIAELTATAREIGRTRDPSRHMPQQGSDDEVGELAATLEEMLQALDRAQSETEATLARQREFVADASHELRTPLTSVLANLELLEETLEGDQRDAAASALRSSRRMRRLVADLLLLARADAGRVVPHVPLDLGQVLVEVAGELEPLAASADHEFSIDTSAEGTLVSGARDELHRMALNLVENSLRHTPPGTHVHAALQHVGDEVVLTVQDDGPGIPEPLREKLFERFVRGGGDRAPSGSGLGLAIVRAVARSHGGDVTVDETPGGGARFVVRLPAASQLAVA
ncbi:HAMP domain-containing sensor histidine kinase [Conexibacter sp. JD483]|uniref:HAMP domain-containing sensor histidine kinase n=1 Tax=unclassified Conexibacter TaxID=2627773 RepID=UPI0027171648|nr:MULTISPECIES: HAMP domain-containing sensor histidine kinase [unclassified Conexibacter]MDO8188092.1 HAMP domain-containing sensor histidine kinase [Conexibacter sp. CPCC 205706]MDO8196912.1 HAMP domain-containing sensor histidine kinase [Conexibacter sp. CPCC 205762]MDR9370041.1 HAMP domain-containing sensor histidine kinase [Conexibacter sp. JD483]